MKAILAFTHIQRRMALFCLLPCHVVLGCDHYVSSPIYCQADEHTIAQVSSNEEARRRQLCVLRGPYSIVSNTSATVTHYRIDRYSMVLFSPPTLFDVPRSGK